MPAIISKEMKWASQTTKTVNASSNAKQTQFAESAFIATYKQKTDHLPTFKVPKISVALFLRFMVEDDDIDALFETEDSSAMVCACLQR